MKKSIVLATAVAAALTSGVAAADLTANATIASNYIWRGASQTFDAAAGQGGIDWGHDSGLYVGTWVSNVDFDPVDREGYEMDVYAGFAGEAGSVGYDLGVITYQYPLTPNVNFTEVYVSGTASIVTIGVNYTVDTASGNDAENTVGAAGFFDEGDAYLYGSLDFPAGKSDISIYAGSYMFTNDGKSLSNGNGSGLPDGSDGFFTDYSSLNYNHFGASIGKDGFKFAVDKNDIDDSTDRSLDNVRFTVSYTIDFEL